MMMMMKRGTRRIAGGSYDEMTFRNNYLTPSYKRKYSRILMVICRDEKREVNDDEVCISSNQLGIMHRVQ